MKVLVAVASRHGSTTEIAEAIKAELARDGHHARVVPCEEIGAVDEYDAVVLGSAIYMGQWMKSAKEFAAREGARLTSVPVWLFSSGPVVDSTRPEDPADRRQGDKLAETLGARDHMVFHGKVDKGNLSIAERAIIRMVKAPNSDQRDWDGIRSWGGRIAAELDSMVADY